MILKIKIRNFSELKHLHSHRAKNHDIQNGCLF
jgi:hypothetical protein